MTAATHTTENRYRLYRLPKAGWLAGVAAGISDYLGIDVRIVRVAWILGLIFFAPPTILAYIVLTVVLPRRPEDLFGSEEEQALRRAVHLGPHDALREAKMRLRDAEERVGRLEGAILSEDFQLRRKFRDLG